MGENKEMRERRHMLSAALHRGRCLAKLISGKLDEFAILVAYNFWPKSYLPTTAKA